MLVCWQYPRVGGVFLEDFAKADDLQAALIAAGFPEESLSGTTVLQLELPKSSGQHIASDRMQDVTGSCPRRQW